jgi:arylsulfatase A-like enzyme
VGEIAELALGATSAVDLAGLRRQYRCQRRIARQAEQYLRLRWRELVASLRQTTADRFMTPVRRRCDGLRVDRLPVLGGPCASIVGRAGSVLDTDRVIGCLRASLERIVQRVAATPLRPSIVLVVTDDQRWDTMAYMPETLAALAGRGIDFRNGFATTSLCCPARATILTGRYAHNHGVLTNGGALDFDPRDTLAVWLTNAGYRTALIGKYMNNNSRLGATVPPGWDVWQTFVENGGSDRLLYDDYTLNENTRLVRYLGGGPNYSTDLLAGRTIDFMTESAAEPFFVIYAPFAPHAPAVPAARHVGRFADIPPWRPPNWREEDMAGKPGWVQFQRFLLAGTPPAALDALRINQLETLLAVDEAVGRISDALEDLGLTDNTIVIYTSDNGFHWGEHWLSLKNDPYEESIRVPLIVRYPLLVPAPRIADDLALHLDLAPTLVELAEVPSAPAMDGMSLVPLLRNEGADWRADFLIEHFVDNIYFDPSAGVRTERLKYVRTEAAGGVREELYDLEADPYELDNLAGDTDHAEVQAALAERLLELQAR